MWVRVPPPAPSPTWEYGRPSVCAAKRTSRPGCTAVAHKTARLDPTPIAEWSCPICGRLPSKHRKEHSDTEYRVLFYRMGRDEGGGRPPPLPPPGERRRIRKGVGLAQADVASELNHRPSHNLRVTRHAVYRREQPVASDGHHSGQEPTGERRREYSALLDELKRLGPDFYDAQRRSP